MKKIIAISSICLCFLSLAGCTSEKKDSKKDSQVSISTTKKQTTDTSSSSQKTETSTSSSSQKAETNTSESQATSVSMWNTQKAEKLQTFMQSWGSTMGQSYKEYRPNNNVSFYGLQLPDGVLGSAKKWSVAVNENIVSAEWSENGRSSAEYSIVAVYSDAETGAYANKHVYFFGFHNEQPIVLVSMQNQGMPDNALHFKQTENNDLNNGFKNITEEKPAS